MSLSCVYIKELRQVAAISFTPAVKMFSLAAFALLVVGACSLPADILQELKPKVTAPQHCCTPLTWQSDIVDLKDDTVVSTTAIDYEKKLEGVRTIYYRTGQTISRTLIDYKKKMSYQAVTVPGQTPVCYKMPFTMPLVRCTNDSLITDVTYMGSSTLGMKGKGIDYDAYYYRLEDTELEIALASFQESDGLCYPVLESVKNKQTDSILMFNQVIPKIEDPTILDMPALCEV